MKFIIVINIKQMKLKKVEINSVFVTKTSDLTEMVHIKIGRQNQYQ